MENLMRCAVINLHIVNVKYIDLLDEVSSYWLRLVKRLVYSLFFHALKRCQ